MKNRCVFCGIDFGSEVRVCPRCREYKGVEEYTEEPQEAATFVAQAGWETVEAAFEWFNDDRSHGDDYVAAAARELYVPSSGHVGGDAVVDFVAATLTRAAALRQHDEAQVLRRERKFDAEVAAVEAWASVDALRGTVITTTKGGA